MKTLNSKLIGKKLNRNELKSIVGGGRLPKPGCPPYIETCVDEYCKLDYGNNYYCHCGKCVAE